MKRITLLLMAIGACLFIALAQTNDTISTAASSDDSTVVTLTDPAGDSSQWAEVEKTTKRKKEKSSFVGIKIDDDSDFKETIIPIVAIVATFTLPAIIVFLALYYRHRNRKAKYSLAEKALENGMPIPEGLFVDKTHGSPLYKGVSNTFVGLGLFIFLWAVTEEFSIGSIGLLVMCIGIGQVIIYYLQKREDSRTNARDEE